MLLDTSRLGMVDAAGAPRHLRSPVAQILWDGRRLPERCDTMRSPPKTLGRSSPPERRDTARFFPSPVDTRFETRCCTT